MKVKLLNLQTGEFLEKGKDWLDGGEYIEVFFKREDFVLSKCQYFTDSHIEAELYDPTNYDNVYRGNLYKVKPTHSDSKEEFFNRQNTYPKFEDNFDKLFSEYKVGFIESYKMNRIKFLKDNPADLAEPLKSVVEKFSVSVYGGRYVLVEVDEENRFEEFKSLIGLD